MARTPRGKETLEKVGRLLSKARMSDELEPWFLSLVGCQKHCPTSAQVINGRRADAATSPRPCDYCAPPSPKAYDRCYPWH